MASNASSLTSYLESLPGTTFRRLYQQPSAAFAIFRRMLPKLAKTIVMGILYMPNPFTVSDLDAWVRASAKREKDQVISILRSLHIISRDNPSIIALTPNFRNSLRMVLEGTGEHQSFGVPSEEPIPPDVDLNFLDHYAKGKWDGILHFVVNSAVSSGPGDRGSNGPKQSVKDLMIRGHLVERRGGSGISITQAGFTFLLQVTNSQVWNLLLLWLESVDAAASAKGTDEASREGLDSVDMLSFFFLLASLELGRAYDTDALTEARRNMLPNLVDFGLVYVPPTNARQFFPTRLATTLTSSEMHTRSISAGFAAAAHAGTVESNQEKSAIILETNFRVYAYVDSPLQIAVLALFVDLKYRFKGLVSGVLTRASIRRAVDMGITSDQIISYLATHAHEEMHRVGAAAQKPVLPPVVVDQIRLWQLDTERMLATSGFLFKDFDDYKEYNEICNFADDIGVVAWRNDRKGMFFATKVDQIKDFMRTRKKANESKHDNGSQPPP
ncbi:transcription factor Tfb2-domain-containing protein [Xylaria bambusicola]|uniref:transcription factor Tfb2-domain-containing protein n=1 Tax=Xylaria bambusicola TaxID=326684 RepID=UPI0020085739|nr:transcription factor Tfb2-domain-containing protein [Xylaria bambusicola]KAI0505197.1 transcription factor Tfb2-domain-containing protein [Xylaria bambusicola]